MCRIAVIPVGQTALSAHSRFVVALLAAEGLDVPLCDVPLDGAIASAPLIAIEHGALSLEFELGTPRAPSLADAEACFASRSIIRGVIGLCDGSAHGDDDALKAAVRGARSAAQQIHRSQGPPGTLSPLLSVFIFCATEYQLERAASFGPDVRFITSTAHASDPSLSLHLRFLVADFASGILSQLDAEAAVLQRLEENGQPPQDAGAGHAASMTGTVPPGMPEPALASDALDAVPAAPPSIGAGGILELGLSSGLGSFGLALGALRKRWAGRLAVRRAELMLCLCSPLDALDSIERASKALRSSAPDALFLGLCELLRAAALVQRAHCSGGGGGGGAHVQSPPFLPDAAAALREAIAHLDAAAALPDVGGVCNAVVELALGARVRLARYLHTRPPERALASLAAAAGCAEEDLLTQWATGALPDVCLLEPSNRSAAVQRLEAEFFTAAPLIRALTVSDEDTPAADNASGVAAFLTSRMKKATAAAAGVAESVKTAVATAAASASNVAPGADAGAGAGLRAGGLRVPLPAPLGAAATVLAASGGGAERAAVLAEAIDLLITVVARAREIRSPQFQARTLLQCADMFEAAGLWRRAETCIFRANRLLRALQVVPEFADDFFPPRASSEVSLTPCAVERGAAAGACLYDMLLNREIIAIQVPVASPRPWPLPWLGSPGERDSTALPSRPSALFTAASSWPNCRPAMAAALLLLACEARDGDVLAAITAYNAGSDNAGSHGARGCPSLAVSKRSASSPGARIVYPARAASAYWAQALISDFWQCGELPLAAETAALSSHLMQLRRQRLQPRSSDSDAPPSSLRLPRTTQVLKVPVAGGVGDAPWPYARAATGALCASAAPPGIFSKDLLAAVLRRRALCSSGAAAVALRSPALVLRAILNGTTVSAALSPVDALMLLKVLAAFPAEEALLGAHATRSLAPACSTAGGALPTLAAWNPPRSRGLLGTLQGSLCQCCCSISSCSRADLSCLVPHRPPASLIASSPHGPSSALSSDDQPWVILDDATIGSGNSSAEIGGSYESWSDPGAFAARLAAYISRSVSAVTALPILTQRFPMLRVEQGSSLGASFFVPSTPCFPLEIQRLEWRLPPSNASVGGTSSGGLLLELRPASSDSSALSPGGVLRVQATAPSGRPTRSGAGRRVYDDIPVESVVRSAPARPLARAAVEIPTRSSSVLRTPANGPSEAAPASPVSAVAAHFVLVLRNTSSVEISGTITATVLTHDATEGAARGSDGKAGEVSRSLRLLSLEQVVLPPRATVSVACALSAEVEQLPLLVRVTSVLLCCDGALLHRLELSRSCSSATGDCDDLPRLPLPSAAADEDWDLHLTLPGPAVESLAVAPPTGTFPVESGMHAAYPTTASAAAAAMGFAVYGATWCVTD